MTADTDQPTLAVTLLACPFCGGEAYEHQYDAEINCGRCEASVRSTSQHDIGPAITAWNTRTNSEPRPAGDLREALARVFCAFDNDGVASASVPQNAAFFAHWLAEDPQYYEAADAALHLIATHSPAPMAGEGFVAVVGLRRQEQRIDSVAELLRLINGGAQFVSIRAAAHPSTQEGGDRG